jgi:ketosteroid isomerase-like protein
MTVEQSSSIEVGSEVLARLEALEGRVRELEDVREINDVFRRWHRACTGGFNGIPTHRTLEGIDLLTDDATIEVQGLHEPGTGPTGREALLAYFKPYHGTEGLLPRVFQTGVDYGVTVTGDTAVQDSNLVILTGYNNGNAAFSMSRYRNGYRRTDAGWRITRIGLEQGFTVPLDSLQTAAEYFASMPQ